MSDGRSNGSMALDWRGPLLAAGIFAAAFAILLLMAQVRVMNSTAAQEEQAPFSTSTK